MALTGPTPLTDEESEAADNMARVQADYFDRFEREVRLNPPVELAEPPSPPSIMFVPIVPQALDVRPMTAKEFAARAASYGGSPWATQNILRARSQPPGTLEARFHLRREKHAECAMCKGETAKGWVPVGTLLPLGDSICLSNCDCFWAFSHPKSKIIWVVGEKPPKGLT
jgi:hypothetical protein